MIVHRTKSWHSGHFLLWGLPLADRDDRLSLLGNLLIDTKHPFRTGLSFAVAVP